MNNSALAAQPYTVREFTQTPKGVAKALQKVREIGYRAMQVSAFGPVEATEVRMMLEDSGLTGNISVGCRSRSACCASHVSYDRLKDNLLAAIDEHHLWGWQQYRVFR